jgi:hypothetical protein
MGWSDPHWAKIKSQAIIEAMLVIRPMGWTIIRIKYEEETAFTKSLERLAKTLNSKPRYLAIRTWSEPDHIIQSTLLVHNWSPEAEETYKQLGPGKEIHSAREIRAVLEELFKVEADPPLAEGKKLKRFSVSTDLRPDLVIARMEALIEKARNKVPHPLVEGVRERAPFETTMASFIKADIPFIYNLKIRVVFQVLVALEKKKQIITRDEVIRIIQKVLEGGDWEKEGFYNGLPMRGSERDDWEGKFITYKGNHSVLSIRVGKESAWDLDFPILSEPGEEYME